MSRYAVTGAAGFLGRHLVARLLANGHDVRALVRRESDASRVKAPGARIVQADLLNPDSLHGALAGVEIVCHCAAKLPTNTNPEEVWDANVKGTSNLIAASLACGVRRLVFVSTDSVYADAPRPVTEDDPLDPDHVYEGNYPHSKLEGERLVLDAWRSRGLEVSIIRPSLIYGPDPSEGTDHFARWAAKRFHILIGGGACRISTVFVSDVTAAIELAAESPAAVGRAYNVTDGIPYSKRNILEIISEVTGHSKTYLPIPGYALYLCFRVLHAISYRFSPAFAAHVDPRRIVFSLMDHAMDIGRIRSELGYEPSVGLREGLRRTLGMNTSNGTSRAAETKVAGNG